MSDEQKQVISETITAYVTAIDTRNVIADYGNFSRWRSVDVFAQFMIDVHREIGPTSHRISNSNSVITLDDTTAKVKTYVDALLMTADSGGAPQSDIGYYRDSLVYISDDWKIKQRAFTLVHTG